MAASALIRPVLLPNAKGTQLSNRSRPQPRAARLLVSRGASRVLVTSPPRSLAKLRCSAANSDAADTPPGEEDYDPNDFAVSDEPVPDDILETLAASGESTEVAGTPEFAALVPPSPPPEGFFASAAGTVEQESQDEVEAQRRDLKLALMDSLFGLERGIRASSEGRAEIAELVAQLEAINPVPATAEAVALLGGRWILSYTSFSELLPLLAASYLPLVKVGDIVQTVDTDSATVLNSVSFIGPFSTTTFEASATFEIRSPKRLQIKFQEGSISPPTVTESSPSTNSLPTSFEVFGQTVDFASIGQALQPLQEAAASVVRSLSGLPPLKFQLGSAGAQSWLLTTYLDEDIRISRGDGGGLFVLVKEDSPYKYQ